MIRTNFSTFFETSGRFLSIENLQAVCRNFVIQLFVFLAQLFPNMVQRSSGDTTVCRCLNLNIFFGSQRFESDCFGNFRLLLLLLLPDAFRGMVACEKPWSPRSQATPQGLDQRPQRDRELSKSERHKESLAGQCRMR